MKKWIAAALITLPLLGGIAVAGAAPARDGLPDAERVRPQESDRPQTDQLRHDGTRVAGLVTGEHGQSFELRTRRGPVTVHWTPDTDCALDGETVDCGAIDPGHGLGAVGEFAGDSNQFHARIIRARTIDRPHLDRIAGVVVRDGDGALGVRTADGELTVLYGDGTTCRTPEAEIRCDDIEVGHHIGAVGQLSGSEFTARVIVVRMRDGERDHARIHGRVSAAHERLLQVETRDGTWNVQFGDDTRCALRDGTAIDCSAIETGMRVGAAGAALGDHSLDAKVIVAAPPPERDAIRDRAQDVVRGARPALDELN